MTCSRSIPLLVFVCITACDPIILGDLGTGTTSDDGADGNPSSSTPTTNDVGEASSEDDGPTPDMGEGGEASGADSDDPSTSSSAFIPDVSDGGAHSECDLYAQDCGLDEKCMPWADDGGNVWSGTRCFPVAVDPVSIAETCIVEGSGVSGIDNCAAGVVCYDVDPKTNEGVCAQLCAGPEEVCLDPETVCVADPSGVANLCIAP